MTKKALLFTLLALLLPVAAFAGTVDFSTSGTVTGLNISFTGVSYTNVDAYQPGGSGPLLFGTFQTLGACPNSTCTGSFTLTISQTQPGTGSQALTATIVGTMKYNQANGTYQITFNNVATTINGINYTVQAGVFLSGNLHQTAQLYGQLIAAPEPNAQLMLGLGGFGLMGLAFVSRRRILS